MRAAAARAARAAAASPLFLSPPPPSLSLARARARPRPAPLPRAGFAASLLRRFAEEARDGGQPYPAHWFGEGGEWRGIGAPSDIDSKTRAAFRRTADAHGVDEAADMFSEVSLGKERGAADGERPAPPRVPPRA